MNWTPMRGQVVLREAFEPSGSLWTPEPNPRDVKVHVGVVLAIGAPARTTQGVEIAPEFKVGDRVVYFWDFREDHATRAWGDEPKAKWLPYRNILAVVD